MNRTRPIGGIGALMLLVSAVAVAMRNHREVSEVYSHDWVETFARRWPDLARPLVGPALRLGSDLDAVLIVMTLGLGLVALRRPFVPRGRRWPGRGVVAIAVAFIGLIYCVARVALEALADPASGYFGPSNPHFVSDAIRFCGGWPRGGILGAWSLLALAGRWQSEPDGFERLGRLLGWSWLASFGFDLFRSVVG